MGQTKRRALIFGMLFWLMMLTGCTKKEIFQDADAKYRLEALKDTDLAEDVFYAKDSSKFYEVYMPKGEKEIYWLMKDTTLIPSMYKDEIIACASQKSTMNNVSLQRYEYLGYTLGIYGLELDKDGYLCFSVKENTVEGSDAQDKFWGAKSDNIRIISINDEPVTREMVSDKGIFKGLEKDKEYALTFYSGSYHGKVTIKADIEMLEYMEENQTGKVEITKNGYFALYMPEDLKSGYYMVDKTGFVKYYNYDKGEKKDSETDMNVPSYTSEDELSSAYSQQYVLSVKEVTKNVGVQLTYNSSQYNDEEISCVLTAPDGSMYNMPASFGTAYVELSEMMSGRWIVNVSPKDLEIYDLIPISTRKEDEATPEIEEIYITESDREAEFYVNYTGEGDIWGIVTSEDGESQIFTVNAKTKQMQCYYAYLPAGMYTVTVYHYADTNVNEIGINLEAGSQSEEIIIIEE